MARSKPREAGLLTGLARRSARGNVDLCARRCRLLLDKRHATAYNDPCTVKVTVTHTVGVTVKLPANVNNALSLAMMWVARSRNRKTGNIPTLWIADLAAAYASCAGCPLRPVYSIDRHGKLVLERSGACYAWSGMVRAAAISVAKAAAAGKDMSLATALRRRHKAARLVRVSAIGDAGRIGLESAREIQAAVAAEGLRIVGYSHHWREADVALSWRGVLRASCETLEDADAAVDAGWFAATLLPSDADVTPGALRTPAGRRIVVCPAQTGHTVTDARTGKKRAINCNDCRMCAQPRVDIVGFLAHGNGSSLAEAIAVGTGDVRASARLA